MDDYISIIIPTFREWHLLKDCVNALINQTYCKDKFEVIIVNNDPTDEMPANFCLPDHFRVISEIKEGSYAARNTGLKYAKGNIVGFTDSDCIPDKFWIENAVKYLNNHPSCSRVAGKISIIHESNKPTIIEVYNDIYAFPQLWLIENGGGSITANLFTYHHIFEHVGEFNEALFSMGDMEWGNRANELGYLVAYVENVMVFHPKRNLEQLIKKEKRHGGGSARICNDRIGKLKVIGNFFYELRPRFNSIKFMFGRKKGLTRKEKFVIPFLRYFLLSIRAYERLKVQMGKQPNRT